MLACAIAAIAGRGFRIWIQRLASRRLALVTSGEVPFRYQTLTFQRAALASGYVLPIYGSSELFCCGRPFRPTDVFASRPTGFEAFAIGHAGTGDLYFAQTFAALAGDLRGRRVVVSDSPTWFSTGNGPSPARYGSNFSPEAAYAFVFAAPLPLAVRELGARRMLAFPDTLRDDPLLARAIDDLAHPTPIRRAEYAALAPLGRLAAWALEVRDAGRTASFLLRDRRRPGPPPRPARLDWVEMAERGTHIASATSRTNPFGFDDQMYREVRRGPKVQAAVALFDTGRSNRDGDVLPAPPGWKRSLRRSTEWTDLRLALRVLRAVGARPLVWTMPLAGAFYDYTAVSKPLRRVFYERYQRTNDDVGMPWLDFRAHDEDTYFVADPGSHLSARGWVFADRALDVFWQTGSIDEVRDALATLDRAVPPPAPPREMAATAGAPTGAAPD